MNRRKLLDKIVNWWSVVAAVAALIAFAVPFNTQPTEQDPTGLAGLFAPVVALCVAAMILAEATRAGGLQIRRWPSICIGLGSMGSAYLWMAAEGDAHPLDPELPLLLAVLFGIASAIVAISLLIAWSNSRPNNQSSSN